MTRSGKAAALGAGALVAALAFTWPLARAIDRAVVTPDAECARNQCTDTLLSVWIVVEASRRLRGDPRQILEAGVFHPMRHALAYSEMGFSLALVAAPVDLLSRNPALAYNAAYLGIFALTFIGVFLVVGHVTRDPRAAVLAALAAAWNPGLWNLRGQPFALGIHWVPFVLHAVLLQLDRPGAMRITWIAVTMLLVAHSSVYYGLPLPILMAVWTGGLLLARGRRSWRAAAGVVLGGAMGLVLIGITYWPYVVVREELQVRLSGYFPAFSTWYHGALTSPRRYVASLVASRSTPTLPLLPYVLVTAAALAAGWRRVRAPAPADRARLVPHLLAALGVAAVAAILSLGPEPGLPAILTLVQRTLSGLPGFENLRAPHRYALLAHLAMAIAMGVALAILLGGMRRRGAVRAFLAMLAVVIVVESRIFAGPMPLTTIPRPHELPRVYAWLRQTPADTAVLELPAGEWTTQTRYMLATHHHGRRLANGYSAIQPVLGSLMATFPSDEAFEALADAGITVVVLHEPALRRVPGGAARLARVEADPSLARIRVDGALVVPVPPRAPPPPPAGAPLPRNAWTTEPALPGATDGNLDTHWVGSGSHARFRIRLRRPDAPSALVLHLGPHLGEAPSRYHVRALHDDGRAAVVGSGRVRPPLWSYRRDHRAVTVALPLHPTPTRLLEVELDGVLDRRLPLAIHGLDVLVSPRRPGERVRSD